MEMVFGIINDKQERLTSHKDIQLWNKVGVTYRNDETSYNIFSADLTFSPLEPNAYFDKKSELGSIKE